MLYKLAERLLLADLNLSFKGNSILRNIKFEIFDTIGHGQVVALLGPSGSGKTQIFRCIAGHQLPTKGGVWINSTGDPVVEGDVGVVAQDYPLIETRTVLGNLTRAYKVSVRRKLPFFSRVMRSIKNAFVEDREAKQLALEYLEKFGLKGIAHRYPCQLSGGQRQRVAIVQQMICSKHYLLMDEPFSGLDLNAKERACELIMEFANADELSTIIITTHDVRSACAVADRIILIGPNRNAEGVVDPAAPDSCIVEDWDLKTLDLCWVPGITKTEHFRAFVALVEERFQTL